MKIDDTIKDIILEIKNEVKKEKDIELSEQEIFDIANSQFMGGAFGVTKCISFFFSYIGTFVFKNKKDYIESVKEISELKEHLTEEQYREIIEQKKIANKNNMNASTYSTIKNIKDLPGSIKKNNTIDKYNELYNIAVENE